MSIAFNIIVRRTQKLAVLSLSLLLAALSTVQITQAEDLHAPENLGMIDLRQKDWGQGDNFSLQGSWRFTWNAFTHDTANMHRYSWSDVPVPGPWSEHANNKQEAESAILPIGYGTYYIKLLVPKDKQKVFIHLPDMASAYELWQNGAFLAGMG